MIVASIVWTILLASVVGTVFASWSCWSRGYFQFLFAPWRVFVFFVVLLLGNAFNVKYAVLAEEQYGGVLIVGFTLFLTAPWAVGTLLRIIVHRIPNFFRVLVALVMLLAPAAVAELYTYCLTGQIQSVWSVTSLLSAIAAVVFGVLLSIIRLQTSPRFVFQLDDWKSVTD